VVGIGTFAEKAARLDLGGVVEDPSPPELLHLLQDQAVGQLRNRNAVTWYERMVTGTR
jgi:hypothetical protein